MSCEEFYKATETIASKLKETNDNKLSFFSGKSEAYKFAMIDNIKSLARVCPKYMEDKRKHNTNAEYGEMIYMEYDKFSK